METGALHRREGLILTAIEVIDELGIQGLSVREVAKRQGISNASIFSHFASKQELMLAVLQHFTQYDTAVLQAIVLKGLKSVDAIRYFIESYYTYYENYPQITAIIMAYDGLRHEGELAGRMKSILSDRIQAIGEMVREAQNMGAIRRDTDSSCIADVIFGACNIVCLEWRVANYSFPLRERIMYTLGSILDAYSMAI